MLEIAYLEQEAFDLAGVIVNEAMENAVFRYSPYSSEEEWVFYAGPAAGFIKDFLAKSAITRLSVSSTDKLVRVVGGTLAVDQENRRVTIREDMLKERIAALQKDASFMRDGLLSSVAEVAIARAKQGKRAISVGGRHWFFWQHANEQELYEAVRGVLEETSESLWAEDKRRELKINRHVVRSLQKTLTRTLRELGAHKVPVTAEKVEKLGGVRFKENLENCQAKAYTRMPGNAWVRKGPFREMEYRMKGQENGTSFPKQQKLHWSDRVTLVRIEKNGGYAAAIRKVNAEERVGPEGRL